MYVIKTANNGKQIYFVSKEYGPKFKLPLVKFSTNIDTATKYDNLDIAISKWKDLLNCNFSIYQVCPSCGNEFNCYPAISRKDNKTEICPDCGMMEALDKFIRG